MSKHTVRLESWEADRQHRAKVIAKLQKIQGLQALLETHEASPRPDYDYVRELKVKLRSVQNQYRAMADSDEVLFT